MKTSHKVAGGSAAIIAAAITFTPGWEGMDLTAKKDMIGTGHPITYCIGATAADGAVKVGQKFTPSQCDALLAKSLPKYLAPLQRCIKVELPTKSMAAFLDAAYNAGSAAVCRSPMVKKANTGDLIGACNAFSGWYVSSDGVVRRGLVARRGGDGNWRREIAGKHPRSDGRKGEKQLCLEGLAEGVAKPSLWDKIKLIFISIWKGIF